MGYNGKIRCLEIPVDNCFKSELTVGKTYVFVGGKFTYDEGSKSNTYHSFKDFMDRNDYEDEFEEVAEDTWNSTIIYRGNGDIPKRLSEVLTVNKVYRVIDGRFTYDDGDNSTQYENFTDFIKYNPIYEDAFEEVTKGTKVRITEHIEYTTCKIGDVMVIDYYCDDGNFKADYEDMSDYWYIRPEDFELIKDDDSSVDESKFKVGDKVLIIGNTRPRHYLDIGSYATVKSVDEDVIRVLGEKLDDDGTTISINQTINIKDLRLANGDFEIGDYLKVIGNGKQYHYMEIGDIVEFKGIDSDGDYIVYGTKDRIPFRQYLRKDDLELTIQPLSKLNVKDIKSTSIGQGGLHMVEPYSKSNDMKEVFKSDIDFEHDGKIGVTYINVGTATIAIPSMTPVGISYKHQDDEYCSEVGQALAYKRMHESQAQFDECEDDYSW